MAIDPNAAALAAGATPGQTVTVNGQSITVQAPSDSNSPGSLSGADVLHKQNPSDPAKKFSFPSLEGLVNLVGHTLIRGIDSAANAFQKIIHPTGHFEIHTNDTKKPVSYSMNPGHNLNYTGGGNSNNHDGHDDHATKGSHRSNASGSRSLATGKTHFEGAGGAKIGGAGGDGGAEIYETTKYVLAKKDIVNTVEGDLHNKVTGDIFNAVGGIIYETADGDISSRATNNYDVRSDSGNIQIKAAAGQVKLFSTGTSSIIMTPTSITMTVGGSSINITASAITVNSAGFVAINGKSNVVLNSDSNIITQGQQTLLQGGGPAVATAAGLSSVVFAKV
jgi:hypothetical protein